MKIMFKKVSGIFILSFCFLYQVSFSGVRGDKEFESFKDYYIESLWQLYPDYALSVGYHKYDSILVVPDDARRKWQLELLNSLLDSLSNYKGASLTKNNLTDLWMIRDQVNSDIWSLTEFKSYKWNPSNYNVGGSFAELLNSQYAPLDIRLRTMNSRFKKVHEYYEAAKKNIDKPTLEHTELAVIQSKGALSVFGESFMDSVNVSGLTKAEKAEIAKGISMAKESISGYINYLEVILKNTKETEWRSYRLGKELYDQKFKYDIVSEYTAEQIYEKAVRRKVELHSKMAEYARKLWPKYMGNQPIPGEDKTAIRQVIDKISLNHVHRDSFMISIENQIPELVKFVTEHELIFLDPEKPLVVRQTPGYMEGSGAGASISSPGPYDKYGNTYYNVSPLTGYTPEEAESYLREYNHYILQILNIHEAIPGHYTQLVYSNNSPSLIKSILGNGAMVEGWAVYSELMMLENGYGNNEEEMWLMYYKWHLRSVCNTILDYSVHVLEMPEKVAIKFLTEEAFQQEAEASGKWRRVKLSQVQLTSYFTGFSEIYDLRTDVMNKEGDDFSLRKFHEQFLSYGSAPVKYIKKLMLQEEN